MTQPSKIENVTLNNGTRYLVGFNPIAVECDDCQAVETTNVAEIPGLPADVENGPHPDDCPSFRPICSDCWPSWVEYDEAYSDISLVDADMEKRLEGWEEDRDLLSAGEAWF